MKARALVSWNLRRIRGELGLSQEALAADAQVSRAHMSEIERENVSATVDLLERLAKVLKVEIDEFFRKPQAGAKKLKMVKVGRKPIR